MKAIIHWDHKVNMDHTHLRFMYQYWDYTCRGFGMDPHDFAFVDLEGSLPILSPPNKVVKSLDQALMLFPTYTPVYIHYFGRENLPGFNHPDNPIYIIGPNYGNFNVPPDALSVKIAAAWGDLWGHVALGIVFYDRSLK